MSRNQQGLLIVVVIFVATLVFVAGAYIGHASVNNNNWYVQPSQLDPNKTYLVKAVLTKVEGSSYIDPEYTARWKHTAIEE